MKPHYDSFHFTFIFIFHIIMSTKIDFISDSNVYGILGCKELKVIYDKKYTIFGINKSCTIFSKKLFIVIAQC